MQPFVFLLSLFSASLVAASTTSQQFQVLHAIGDASFSLRGQIAPTEKKSIVSPRYESAAALDLTPLRTQSSSETDLYHVKIVSSAGIELQSSIRLCQLQSAQFVDSIAVHFDEIGNPFHLDYSVDLIGKDGKCGGSVSSKAAFKTKVAYVKTLDGARPRLEQMTADIAAGKTDGGEKTFLQKYWYYLIPLAIILLMSGGEEEKK
ncbi:UNVERIFIED_CONTAM: hypothetical protein HDU68_005185 [Siphonaria sp. JEL0065]|nr:hypothetical protein HDU68_005185 [Siphonaria sp. JEL0065]